jgi:putative transposase
MRTDEESRSTEEQIAYALRHAESGTPPADVCRQVGVSEATFYIWRKKYAHLGVSEVRKLRSLEDENARLKRLVARPDVGQARARGGAQKRW